ncbi:PPE family protein [[Mycobacterium] holstebronense]|uniref:PPE family protein n=1 Tax=[Mycobacterium] holstebronense TaxID=3064288 RepID=A0ABN9NEV9_9MYCO|nr:PPE family protein [Mycolicibacter sp. MU0102]CAJ1503376.1 PPE family protein [Mycolicibacter sp. MU0102]
MDFAVLPPEVNSGRLYSGPGSGPMLAAATAWARLASETALAAGAYQSVLTGLTDEVWLGPAANSMACALAPYVMWLDETAVLAQQTATGATAAAAAFEEALASMVPPPVIAANRKALVTLIAANVFGQNSAAISMLEAEYAQLWVLDAAAMYAYAAQSAAATTLSSFTDPPTTTDPTGLGRQAAAAAEATAGGAKDQLAQLIAAIPQALQGLAPAAAPLQLADDPSALTLSQLVSYVLILPKSIVPFNDAIKSVLYGLIQYSRNLNTDLDIAAATGGRAGFGSGASALAASALPVPPPATGSGPLSARVGAGAAVGRLSVPPNWVTSAPVATMAAAAQGSGVAGVPAAAAAAAEIPCGVFGDLGLAGLAGRALTGSAPRSRPAAAMNGHAQSRLERLVTELAGTTEVQHWHVDPDRLDSLLEELAEQPGVHAVHVNPGGQHRAGPDRQPG